MFLLVVLLVLGLWLLLMAAPFSTDFAVHKNWLAITSSLPLEQWYFEARFSPWTLDYPPLFAYFEWIRASIAQHVDPGMLVLSDPDYASQRTILFQRLSSAVGSILLGLIVYRSLLPLRSCNALAATLFLVMHPVLVFVDAIHFQFNAWLLALFLLSCVHLTDNRDRRCIAGAALFTSLLLSKHIFLYAAPAVFVFLLGRSFQRGFFFFCKVGLAVLATTLAVLSPFLVATADPTAQFLQIYRRLFPFEGRGLVHAYWAPNFWALYSFSERLLARCLLPSHQQVIGGLTRGLVSDQSYLVLPNISPAHAAMLSAGLMLPALIRCFRSASKQQQQPEQQQQQQFWLAIVYCQLTSFMFGWHVHEKAILVAILPLGFYMFQRPFSETNVLSRKLVLWFSLLLVAGGYCIFPLLFWPKLWAVRLCGLLLYLQLWMSFSGLALLRQASSNSSSSPALLSCSSGAASAYLWLWIVQEFLLLGLSWTPLGVRFPFLPQLATSLYCSLGVCFVWLDMLWHFLTFDGASASERQRRRTTAAKDE